MEYLAFHHSHRHAALDCSAACLLVEESVVESCEKDAGSSEGRMPTHLGLYPFA